MPLDGVAETWFVKVDEKVYGPYTRDQMARFVAEGRVKASSLVALSPEGSWTPARDFTPLQNALAEQRGQFKNEEAGEPANLFVFIDIVSGTGVRVEYELRRLGAIAEIQPGMFVMRTRRTAGAVRNAMSQLLSRGDRLFVMDSSRDRLAWFNLGPEVDARIREVWNSAV